MKKVLFIINSLKYKSGTERVACILANLFDSYLGCEVVVANRDTDKDNVAYQLNPNIKVCKIPGNYYDFYRGLNHTIKKKSPDYIIIHNMGKLSLFCSALNVKNSSVISLEHVAFSKRPLFIRFFSKILYKKYNKIICLTENDKKDFQKIHQSVEVINNISTFDCEEYNYSYDIHSKNVIAIGRLTYQKNFLALLEAWKIILDKMDIGDWFLKIYGKGEDWEILDHFIKKYKLKNVLLMGEVDNIISVYRSASFFVMSSRFEGLPMVLIEAQSLSLPIISFNCPHGPQEVIENNINGYLVKDQDINELSEKILKLIKDVEIRKRFSLCAYKHAHLYSKSQIVSKWLNIINE
ncbi:glycosyltransferase family 4 protein [Acinetobacter indicus]|uniref:glycosyltransferase family 4 protein n=1 Tax=Acinetobacter indicus TaxID=756892 RepID=UPI000CEC885E|nr:glycosyltransferase family 4 protein [Acinetobacter indicus]